MRISNITHNYTTPINKNIYNTKSEPAQETETTGSLGIKTAGMSAAELTSRISFGNQYKEITPESVLESRLPWQLHSMPFKDQQKFKSLLKRSVLATLIQYRPEEKEGLRNLFDTLARMPMDGWEDADILIRAIQDPDFNLGSLPHNYAGYEKFQFGTVGSLENPHFDKYRKPVELNKIELTPEQSIQVDYLEDLVYSYSHADKIFPEYVNWHKYIKTPIQARAMKALRGSYDYKLANEENKFIPKLVENIKNEKELELFQICANDYHLGISLNFEVLKRYFDGKIPYDITSLVINNRLSYVMEPDILENASKNPKTKENLKSIISHFVNNYPKNLKIKYKLDEIITEALEQENPLEYATLEMKKLAES